MMRGVQACIMPSDHIEQFLEANKKESQIHHARQLSGSPPQQQAGQQTKGMFKGVRTTRVQPAHPCGVGVLACRRAGGHTGPKLPAPTGVFVP